MARTTPSKVKQALDTDEDIELEPYIEAANSVVNWLYANCTGMSSLASSDLELVERYLAGHYYASKDPGYTSRSTGGASGSFQGQVAMYFEGTWWGQRAIELDHSGCLARRQQELEQGGKKVASLKWLGKRTSERLDAFERE